MEPLTSDVKVCIAQYNPETNWGYPQLAWEKPSRAVVVCDAFGNGCVLFSAGPHICLALSEWGTKLGEIGLDDAPAEKISIWEGMIEGGSYIQVTGDYEDTFLVGTYREPNDEEWKAIRAGRCPWSESDWGKIDPDDQSALPRSVMIEGPTDGPEDTGAIGG